MSMTLDSTTSGRPSKPYDDFPLFPHACGQWAKKIRGRLRYFGPWANWHAALASYLSQREDLEAGRPPRRPAADEAPPLTVKQMVAGYLEARRLDVDSKALDLATWKGYERYGKQLIRILGPDTVVQTLGPEDFLRLKRDLQATHKSLCTLRSDIGKIRLFFNWAGPGERGKDLYHRPIRFGPDFRTPDARAIKRQLDQQPRKVFYRKEMHRLLTKARPKLRAMILLGINCGLGNTDCARLTRDRLNLKTGWLHYPRPKTGVERRCPLWPETLEAVKKVWEARRSPRNPAHKRYVFLTHRRKPFDGSDVTHEFHKLAGKAKVEITRFYRLRHTFATIASRSNLLKAVDTIMGDKPPANYMVRSVYDHGTASASDLRTVVNLVHDWLCPAGTTFPPASGRNGSQPADPPAEPEPLSVA
jgi:integrase